MINIDNPTVNSFGDEWERFDQTKLSDKVYITNGAPYIEKLEFGASQQNKYFIQKAIDRVQAKHK